MNNTFFAFTISLYPISTDIDTFTNFVSPHPEYMHYFLFFDHAKSFFSIHCVEHVLYLNTSTAESLDLLEFQNQLDTIMLDGYSHLVLTDTQYVVATNLAYMQPQIIEYLKIIHLSGLHAHASPEDLKNDYVICVRQI